MVQQRIFWFSRFVLFSFAANYAHLSFSQAPKNKAEAKVDAKKEEKKVEEQKASLAKPVEFSAGDVWNNEIYGREDHKVIVLQDRKYNKAGGFEFGVHGGVTRASAFWNTLSYGAHLDYYFTEYLGVEGFYNTSTNTANADQKQLSDFFQATFDTDIQKEYHKPTNFGGLSLIWAPIYGKFAFFRSNIIHFDFFGSLGAGYLQTVTNKTSSFNGQVPGRDQNMVTSLLGFGTRVFLQKNWSIRLDVRHAAFNQYFAPNGNNVDLATNPGATLLRQNFQFSLGASFIFGARY